MPQPADDRSLVRFAGMTRRYGEVVAAQAVTFDVRRGEMFGLIGPDGAGKTTTLRVALGLLAPSVGAVRTCGLDPWRDSGLVVQRRLPLAALLVYGDLTVDERAFFAEIHGVAGWKARRDELLEMLRLQPFRDRLADRLSGGMKQKLALSCTLIHTPELLILDEPTTGVDPVSRRDFWRILTRLQREGLTILLTTPYLDEAERCQRVALMDRGRSLSVSTPDALRQEGGATMLELIVRPKREAAEWLRARPEVTEVESFGERLHLHRAGSPSGRRTSPERDPLAAPTLRGSLPPADQSLLHALQAAGFEVESMREIPPSLEDVFIARLRRDPDPGEGDKVIP
jgi:ABC-2 type transport system ATP-binding protein